MKCWTAAFLLLTAVPYRAAAQEARSPDLSTPAPATGAPADRVPLAASVEGQAPAAKAAPADHGIFPLWADWIREKGFTLPKPFGFMTNYYFQQSDIVIDNLELAFNDGPFVDFSEYIQVPKATTRASALVIRPNVMILPFLSAYVVYSSGATETDVDVQAGPIQFSTLAESGAQVVAVGATLQAGYKGFFGVADFNGAVSDVDRLADTVGSNMLSFRLGYNFGTPGGRGFAVWAGSAGQVLEVATEGSVRLGEVLPPPQQSTVDEVRGQCPTLPPGQRVACNALADQLQDWVDTGYDGTVSYRLDKKPAGIWNLVVGAQYALDAFWQFRFESSFLNGRTTFLAAIEYRFDVY